MGVVAGLLGVLTSKWFGLLFWAPMLMDGITQERGLRESNNMLRILTGLLAGAGAGIALTVWIKGDILNLIQLFDIL